MNDIRRQTIAHVKKILVKVDSAVLTGAEGLDLKIIDALVREMSDLSGRGYPLCWLLPAPLPLANIVSTLKDRSKVSLKSRPRRLSARED